MITTATIELLSKIGATISWENTGSLGIITVGQDSELYVRANLTTSSFSIQYELNGGSLPPGLNLNADGTIEGRVPTDETNTSTLITTSTYNFNIKAVDITGYEYLNGDFSVKVEQSTSTSYTRMWCRPLISIEKRQEFQNFINNEEIFDYKLIYRPLDPEFGVQRQLKMVIDFGIERQDLRDYVETLEKNFYKRRFHLGPVRVATAKIGNTATYELVYLSVIDKYKDISKTFRQNGIDYWPATVKNMRSRITDFHASDPKLNPRFTKTTQEGQIANLGYIPYVPICFVLPGKSIIITRRIKDSGYKFNNIDFEADRVFIENVRDYQGTKYLLINQNPGIQ